MKLYLNYTDIYYNNNYGEAILDSLYYNGNMKWKNKRKRMIFISGLLSIIYILFAHFFIPVELRETIHIFDLYLPLTSITWLVAEFDSLLRMESAKKHCVNHRTDSNSKDISLAEMWRVASSILYQKNKHSVISYTIITLSTVMLELFAADDNISTIILLLYLLANIFIYEGITTFYTIPKRIDILRPAIKEILVDDKAFYPLIDVDLILLYDQVTRHFISNEHICSSRFYINKKFFDSKCLGTVLIVDPITYKYIEYRNINQSIIVVAPDYDPQENINDINRFQVKDTIDALALAYTLIIKDGKYDEHNIWAISSSFMNDKELINHTRRIHVIKKYNECDINKSHTLPDEFTLSRISFKRSNDTEVINGNGCSITPVIYKRNPEKIS